MSGDAIESFAAKVRSHCGGGIALVGPVCSAGAADRLLVEVVAAARQPSPEASIVSLAWEFTIPPSPKGVEDLVRSRALWGMRSFLAGLLRRDFATVEVFGNQLEFTRAIEKRWPSPQTKEARERMEAEQQRRDDWERRRVAYIAQRVREGAESHEAYLEFLAQNPLE
jgi:hypothetical protein